MEKPTNIKKPYTLTLKFNDQVFKMKTDDLFNSFLKNKPLYLKTKLIVEVSKGTGKNKKTFSKVVFVPQGKMYFNNNNWLNVFINNIKRYLG